MVKISQGYKTATHKVRGTHCSETQHLSIYDTVSTGNWLQTFPRRLQPPSSAATMKMEAVSSSEMLVCTNLQSVMYFFFINDSNHPTEHKTAAYRQYIKRMQSLSLTESQKTEWKTIKTRAQNNNFPDKVITQLKSQAQQTTHGTMKQTQTKQNKKLAVFTYHSPRIRKLTNLFKHMDIGIAFRSTNTIQQLTKPKPHTSTQ